ncbi:MAG: ABC-F family ATP-binding cassette domain-containing protein [Deferrisomatales bacterium]|nr:ABC-F family ATP-binding cassette domain-containing protein [Deferrisomatales bacterium]
MLDAVDLSKSYGGQAVLDRASFQVGEGERLALVGPNGAGKTTLLRILAGEERADEGEVRRRRGLVVGYLRQEADPASDQPLLAYVEDVAEDVRSMETELREIESRLGEGGSDPRLLERYGHLQTRFEHLGGYALRARAERILAGLGFGPEEHPARLSSFSGGWRMRAALARILLREPDLVLLDEPTNHLDIVSLEWIEGHLQDSPSAFLVVSHDVAFLDRVVRGVLALEGGRIVRTQGGFAQYQAERRLREEQARAAYENWQRRRAQTEAFADRFRYKASKARQVQSRLRQLAREEAPPPPPPAPVALTLHLPQPERSGRTVAVLDDVDAGYAGKPVYRGLTFRIERGEKVALIGPNGAGKSTLLKVLAGSLPPLRGRVEYGHAVSVSYFAQHQLEQLDPGRTALEEMRSLPGLRSELELRSVLGSFLFSGDAVDKRVSVLSGGEKSRLVLAKLLSDPGNFFLLDEPTNHLDLQACEVLKRALETFSGTLCFITHDRDLINRTATRVVYVDGGTLKEYLGTFDDFVRKRAEEGEASTVGRPGAAGEGTPARPGRRDARRAEAERRAHARRETGPLREEVSRLEAQIAAAEVRLGEVESALAIPSTYAESDLASSLSRERAELCRKVEELTRTWEAAATELEKKERAFQG